MKNFDNECYKKLLNDNSKVLISFNCRGEFFNIIDVIIGFNEDKDEYFLRYLHHGMFTNDETREIGLKESEANELLETFKHIKIPLIPSETPVGLDGHTFTVQFQENKSAIKVKWWTKATGDWQDLNKIPTMIFKYLPKPLVRDIV